MNARDLRLRRPEEGWVVVALVVLLGLILAWAVDDPAWVNGRQALTDCLPIFALGGVAVGFVGPKVGWGRWTTHLVGAVFAALVIAIVAGWAEHPGASIGDAFRASATGATDAYLDLAWYRRQYTGQEIHYILVIGGLVWGTMQFASYAVFGHRRPLSAVVVVGLLLLLNISATARNQLPYLIAFATASLFLLIEMHAFDERATWLRRRIGDPREISAMYLRGGTLFIVAAVVGSLLLTVRAASAPLAGAWDGVDDQLIRIGEEISGWLPVGGDFRGGGGVTFGSTAKIAPRWFNSDATAFTATVPTVAEGLKWRAATYDTFALRSWVQTDVTAIPVAPGDPLLDGTPENPSPDLTEAVTLAVRPDQFADSLLLAPGAPTTVDRSANVLETGSGSWFAGVDLPGGHAPYTVTAAVLKPFGEDTITGNKLKVAGQNYPADIVKRYTDVPTDAVGPAAQALLDTILSITPEKDPYDLAVNMEAYLRSPGSGLRYDTNLTDVQCDHPSAVECFALIKRGYCLHYASTMAMLLRDAIPGHPIPTRLVQGFLPGGKGATQTIPNRNAHAWVEVYFPNYGWIPFDPTGGGVGQPTDIPAGQVRATPTPTPAGSAETNEPDPTRRVAGNLPAGQGPGSTSGPNERTIAIVLTVILALVVLSLAVAAWARGPRGEVSPDAAWHTLARTASRLGYAPRPTQTVYEYADALGRLVPVAEKDLRTVADAKVETAYARARLGGARLDALRAATRRLRISLLRLVLRRPRRRRRA